MSQPTFDAVLKVLMQHTHKDLLPEVLQEPRDDVVAASPTTPRFALTTDTRELFLANGTDWYLLPFKLYIEPAAPDIGSRQDSNDLGIYEDAITDKRLSNVSVGTNADPKDGAIQFLAGQFLVYVNGVWLPAVLGLTLREGSDGQLQMQPTGKTEYYDVFTGNSQSVGRNKLPLTQQHNTHIGSHPYAQIMHGGNALMQNPDDTRQYVNRTIHHIVPRTMTDAERLALTDDDVYGGEDVFCEDTGEKWFWNGSDWTQHT